MSDYSDKSKLNEISEIAADWVIKHEHGLSPEEQDQFNEWLTSHDLHRKAYAFEKRSWDELDRLFGMDSCYHKPVNPDLLDEDRILTPKGKIFNRVLMWSMPIAAAVIFFLLIPIFNQQNDVVQEPVVQVEVIQDRICNVRLDDGTIVSLNHGAEITSEYSKEQRLVFLFDGEANFNVTKDPDRPFIVDVGGVRLRAVGTIFNVRFSDQKVDVIVTEGIVAVQNENADHTGATEGEAYLEANHRATVFLDDEIQVDVVLLDQEEVQEELLWQPTMIDFEDAPLGEIIAEFNRRNPVNIVIRDPSIRNMQMSSMFWSDNVEGFIRLLKGKFGIKAQITEDNTVYLYK